MVRDCQQAPRFFYPYSCGCLVYAELMKEFGTGIRIKAALPYLSRETSNPRTWCRLHHILLVYCTKALLTLIYSLWHVKRKIILQTQKLRAFYCGSNISNMHCNKKYMQISNWLGFFPETLKATCNLSPNTYVKRKIFL